MKGFDVYEEVDRLIGTATWKGRIDLTYIGNLPKGFRFQNVRHLAPMDGEALADEIRSHHVYLTASINEPAGMHHVEGALCGLPLLFRNSGALPEYCTGYGEMFDDVKGFHHALGRMIQAYDGHRAALRNYGHTAERMVPGLSGRDRRANGVNGKRLLQNGGCGVSPASSSPTRSRSSHVWHCRYCRLDRQGRS